MSSAADGLRRAGPRPRRRATRCSTRASTSCCGCSTARRRCASERLAVVADLQHRARPRLLHRHGVRDPDGGLRAPRLDLLRRPLRRARERRAHDVPGRRDLVRGDPHDRAAARRRGLLTATRATPTCVLVAVPDEDGRGRRGRRSRPRCGGGASPTEVSPSAQKYGKQIRYAEKRGIPFVWFPQDDGSHQVRDIRTGEQRDGRSGGVGPTGGGPAPRRDRHRRHRQLTFPACTRCTTYRGALVIRTHQAGTLRGAQAGETVTLTGWVARRRDHGGVAFIDLRDASGFVQVVVRDEAVAAGLRNEFCIRVVGEVSTRPAGNANPDLPDRRGRGRRPATVEVLNEAAPLPFQIDEHVEVGEEVRLKYRYLDLRRAGPAAALRLRSEVNRAAREVLHGRDFVEIETPTLTRSTPEGARDFLVPARLSAGQLVRPAAVAAAVQAAADGGRHGALLPDRAVLPGRGLPGRPAAGVHPARHRDELRRPGRRHRRRRDGRGRAVAADRPRAAAAAAADDLRRRDADGTAATSRTCGSARSWSSARRTSRRRRSGCSRRRTSAPW